MARRRGDELPKQRRPLTYDYSFLADEKVWLLVRGEDFPEELRIESVQKRVRTWAKRHGYTRTAGYVVGWRSLTPTAARPTGRPVQDDQLATSRRCSSTG